MRATIHIGNFPVPGPFAANAGKLESGVAPMMHHNNTCANSPARVMCQPPASTVVALASAMFVMILLVAIAVMLLLCSQVNNLQERQRQQNAQEGDETATNNGTLGSNTCDGMVMVLLPGEKDLLTFALPCPLQGEISQAHDEASAASNELKIIESLFSDSDNLHGH